MNALILNNIEVIYDHVVLVLKGVSLTVPRQGIVAILGANGAGKTTTLKAISNLLKAERGEVTKGSIVFDGARAIRTRLRAGVAQRAIRRAHRPLHSVARGATAPAASAAMPGWYPSVEK